jgi:hypothetical protein
MQYSNSPSLKARRRQLVGDNVGISLLLKYIIPARARCRFAYTD